MMREEFASKIFLAVAVLGVVYFSPVWSPSHWADLFPPRLPFITRKSRRWVETTTAPTRYM